MAARGGAAGSGKKPARKRSQRARNRAHDHAHAPDALDALRDRALGDWERVADPMLAPIRALARDVSTYEAFLAGLPKAFGDMQSGELVKSLATATAIARGLGDAGTTAHK